MLLRRKMLFDNKIKYPWTDTFQGTALNSKLWDTANTTGTITVNNQLSMSSARLGTLARVTGKETLIDVSWTVSSESGTYLESKGIICAPATGDIDLKSNAAGWLHRSTYSITGGMRCQGYNQEDWAATPSGYTSYPQTRRMIWNISTNQLQFYLGSTLMRTVSQSCTLSQFVGNSYFTLTATSSFVLTSVVLNIQ